MRSRAKRGCSAGRLDHDSVPSMRGGDAHVVQGQRQIDTLPACLDAADGYGGFQRSAGDALDSRPHCVDVWQQPVAHRKQQQFECEEALNQRPANHNQAEPQRA